MGRDASLEHFAGYLMKRRFLFGAFLVYTGIRITTQIEHDIDLESNVAIRIVRRLLPVTAAYSGQSFFLREEIGGALRLAASPSSSCWPSLRQPI